MHEEGGKSAPNECSLRPVSAPPPLKMFSETRISRNLLAGYVLLRSLNAQFSPPF